MNKVMFLLLFMLLTLFGVTTSGFASEAVYYPTTGRVHIPQLVVDGDPSQTVYSADLQQRNGSLVFDVLGISYAPTAQNKFTEEWLAGKILYQVWYGNGSVNGTGVENVPVVRKLQFNLNNTVFVTGLLNEGSTNTSYHVDDVGRLFFGDDTDEWNQIVCGSTDRYIKTHFYERNSFDNVDFFFFDENDAMSAAEFLNADLPRCPTAP